jgi:hypothetical protein
MKLSSGNTTHSKRVFITQKKTIRIMAGIKRLSSCRELFKTFNILPLTREFLFSLLSFIVDNMEKYQTIPDINNVNTRRHQPTANLTSY